MAEAIEILCACEKKPDWRHTGGMIEEACRIVSALKPPPNDPLALEDFRKMDGRLGVLMPPYKIGDLVYQIAVRKKYLDHFVCTPHIKVLELTTENALKYKTEIGKTVFLTREEAEAALKKMEEADNEAD